MPKSRQCPNINPIINSLTVAVTSVSANYTLTDDDFLVLVNASGGARTVTLPTAIGIKGRIYVIKKTDNSANAVTVATTSSQTIDGATTYSLASQYKRVEVISDGSNWQIINAN